MTDRDLDLIEAAGKAAWLKLQLALGFTEGDREFFTPEGKPWNPLTDDGDALRLAVALDIWVHPGEGPEVVEVVGFGTVHEEAGTDRAAATRRAIVRAAAAMTGEGGAP